MGSSGQLYSLTWGDFGSSLTSAVQLLRGDGDLVDVTLAAGGKSFPAHKIVLSAASPFLLDILKSTPCQHPVVVIPEISSEDLESLLEFVYRGEVSVDPSQLPSLLQAAHCLDIHGLTPPTVLTENGEEVPPSAILEVNDTTVIDGGEEEEAMNSCVPNHRRKKRRKSSSSCSKWPRLDNTNETDDRQSDERTDYEHKNEADDGTHRWSLPVKPEAEAGETKHIHHSLLHSMQYPTLHTGGLLAPGIVTPTFLASAPSPTTTNTSGGGTPSKIRGASDCPGQCALCGATLRQARNLRRHLLTSCKYRFNSNHSPSSSSSSSSQNNQQQQQTVVEIKPDIDVTNYGGPTYMTDSGDNQRGKNVSDQPTTCPLCGAILRQSRNLRRHLELLHFGPNGNSSGIRIRRRKTDFRSPTMVPRPNHLHSLRMDHSTPSRSIDTPDYPPTPLTSASFSSSLMSSPSSSHLGSPPPSCHPEPPSTNPNPPPPPPIPSSLNTGLNNGIYPPPDAHHGTSMLSCLLPNLPSLPPLTTSHDVFRHSEILRAGIAYHDSRHHTRHYQRTDVA